MMRNASRTCKMLNAAALLTARLAFRLEADIDKYRGVGFQVDPRAALYSLQAA